MIVFVLDWVSGRSTFPQIGSFGFSQWAKPHWLFRKVRKSRLQRWIDGQCLCLRSWQPWNRYWEGLPLWRRSKCCNITICSCPGSIFLYCNFVLCFKDDKCRYNPKKSGATDSGMVDIKPDEDHLKEAVATVGPVSIAIDASHESFQFYKEGETADAFPVLWIKCLTSLTW